jgi:hypothetical protein
VEVSNGGFDAGEFIYVVEVLLAVMLAHLVCYMFAGDRFILMVYMVLRLFCPDG